MSSETSPNSPSEVLGSFPDVKFLIEKLSETTFRNCIWNCVLSKVFGKLSSNLSGTVSQEYYVFPALQRHFFKLPMDEIEKNLVERREWFKDEVMTLEPKRLLQFLEFVAKKMIPVERSDFEKELNTIFASEQVGFRLFDGHWISFDSEDRVPLFENGISSFQREGFEGLQAKIFAVQNALSKRSPDAQALFDAYIAAASEKTIAAVSNNSLKFSEASSLSNLVSSPLLNLKDSVRELLSFTFLKLVGPVSQNSQESSSPLEVSYLFETSLIAFSTLMGCLENQSLIPLKPDLKAIHALSNLWGEKIG